MTAGIMMIVTVAVTYFFITRQEIYMNVDKLLMFLQSHAMNKSKIDPNILMDLIEDGFFDEVLDVR